MQQSITHNINAIWEASQLRLLSTTGEDILVFSAPELLLPVIGGIPLSPIETKIIPTEDGFTFCYRFDGPIESATVLLKNNESHFALSGTYKIKEDCTLQATALFPEDSVFNLYKVLNYRNMHCTEHTYPDLAIGDTLETTTYSTDWQFAPHPSLYTFIKKDYNLLVGALSLPKSFGLDLAIDGYRLGKLWENYGEGEHGHKLLAGESFTTTTFGILADYYVPPEESILRFSQLLVEEGYTPDPKEKERYHWHRENLYCTWIDQGYLTDTFIPTDLHTQIAITANSANAVSEAMVLRAAEVIQRERLPFRTLLIDMGWSRRGEWIADPQRFPDFRGLVDSLHEKGYKVVVWWNWAEVDNDVSLDPRWLVGEGWLNKHGQRTIDFSNPITQEEYFKPLFRRLFSDAPDCYNVDGVKTDFLSDKIHPETVLHNPDWRGEENYFYHVFQLFYQEMKSYKKDAVHIGCAGHPYLAQYIDINRTYDIWSSNPLEHVNRGHMLEATSLGTPVAYDFHHFTENLEAYFQQAIINGASVQIGNILGVKDYPLAPWRPSNDEYFDVLRQYLPLLPRKPMPHSQW